MEEHRDHAPREDSPPHEDTPPPASDHHEPVERRDFLRRSVEVAALSLFGVGGLDPLIDRVAARVAERMGGDRLASEVARRLSESGVMMPRAHAALSTPDCPSDYGGGLPLQQCEPEPQECGPPLFECLEPFALCPPPNLHECNQNPPNPFACPPPDPFVCTFQGPAAFHCEWDPNHFYCPWPGTFRCYHTFSCPPWAGQTWFDCVAPGEGGTVDFNCPWGTGEQEFSCALGGGADYLCPGVNQFYPICPGRPDPPWQCGAVNQQEFANCPSPNGQYVCGLVEAFHCSTVATARFDCFSDSGSFECRGVGELFTCDASRIYDFVCRPHFVCGIQGTPPAGMFGCESNHLFACDAAGVDFHCAGAQFVCGAGGNRCHVGGVTGDYDFDEPGDFLCIGPGAFACEADFTCQSADDFTCMGNRNVQFVCRGDFSGCHPGPGGNFECRQALSLPSFYCQEWGGVQFQCQEIEHFSENDLT